jgi:phospholipase/carboxylesterase
MTRELKFGRKAPVSGTARSMVVFLHGYGADGTDLLGLADSLELHLKHTVFYAPDAPEPCSASAFGRQWFSIPRFDGSSQADAAAGLARAADDLNAFLDQRLAEERLMPQDLVLLGFSQGAMMSLHVAPRREVAIAGVVAISGKLINPSALRGEAKAKPPVMLIHGDQDPVVPFDEMSVAGDALVSNDFEVYAHVMKGAGHGIAPDGLQQALHFISDKLGA